MVEIVERIGAEARIVAAAGRLLVPRPEGRLAEERMPELVVAAAAAVVVDERNDSVVAVVAEQVAGHATGPTIGHRVAVAGAERARPIAGWPGLVAAAVAVAG